MASAAAALGNKIGASLPLRLPPPGRRMEPRDDRGSPAWARDEVVTPSWVGSPLISPPGALLEGATGGRVEFAPGYDKLFCFCCCCCSC